MYSTSSLSSLTEVLITGLPNMATISLIILLSGILIPTVFLFLKIFGSDDVVVKIKVKGPGRFLFINLKVGVSTFAYSLIMLKSLQMMDRLLFWGLIPLSSHIFSIALKFKASHPIAYRVSVG